MEPQHTKGDRLVDQRSSALKKLGLVSDIGEDHAHAEPAIDDKADGKPDRQDRLEAEDKRVGRGLPDADPCQRDAGVYGIGQSGLPLCVPRCFTIEKAKRHDPAQGFDQGRLLFASCDDRLFLCTALRRKRDYADDGIECERD